MASTPKPSNPRQSPYATPLRAPLRGQGPSLAEQQAKAQGTAPEAASKPDFEAIARQRAGGQPQVATKQRVSTPMSAFAPAPADPQGRGYAPPVAPAREAVPAPNYANQRLNDPSIREAALQRLAEKQKANQLGRMQGRADTRGMVPGRGDGGMVSPYPSAAITNPTATNPQPTAEDAKGMAAELAALKDRSKPIFGKSWDEVSQMWVDQADNFGQELPAGANENTPGVIYDYATGQWAYDPEKAAGKSAIDAQLAKALTSGAEDYGMSPELLAQNMSQISKQGAASKAKLSQQLAGRGLSVGGEAGAQFGNIDVGTQAAKTALLSSNFAQGLEARQQELKSLLTAHGNELSEKNRVDIAKEIADAEKQKFEYSKLSQKEADEFTFLHDSLANLGATQWSPEAYSKAIALLKSGKSYSDVIGMFGITKQGDKMVVVSKDKSKDSGTSTSPTSGSEVVRPEVVNPDEWDKMAPDTQSAISAAIEMGWDPFGAEAENAYNRLPPYMRNGNWASKSDAEKAEAWVTVINQPEGAKFTSPNPEAY